MMMLLLLWRLLLTDGRGDTLLFPSHGVAFCVAAFLVAALLPELAGEPCRFETLAALAAKG